VRRGVVAALGLIAALATLAGCVTGPRTAPAPVSDSARAAVQAAAALPAPDQLPQGDMPPPAPREFRAAWVATVANIDWPSQPGLSPEAQRAEMATLLDRARDLGLNAIVLQVRPATDAIYPSPLEPWSEFLTGEQGRAPQPAWDPLATWIREAHRRGIELHAWFNPYRAWHSAAKGAPSAQHLSATRPEIVRRYGDMMWLDPGEPAAAAHTLAVVADVLRRYDVDGIHIDDYFYPYPVPLPGGGGDQPFPDEPSWTRYVQGGGTLSRDDWRRDNVNRLVEAMHATVRQLRPQARFGISPFGIGRPDLRPPGIEGFSQYDRLFADVELWIDRGWFDYLAPQLYWAIDRAPQAFPVLLDYWSARTGRVSRHLWPGLFTSSVASGQRQWPAEEIVSQVGVVRGRPAASGHIHFSMVALMQDRGGLATRLKQGPYREAALAPATPWLDGEVPPPPVLRRATDGRVVLQAGGGGRPPFVWAWWCRSDAGWRFSVLPAAERYVDASGCASVVASAVSRTGQESERRVLRLRR